MDTAGYPVRNVDFVVNENSFISVEGTYPGQGLPGPDTASGLCVKIALDDEGVDYDLP